MGSQRKDLVVVQDMNCNQNEYDESIKELRALAFLERANMLQVMVFLYWGPKTKMEIREYAAFYRNGGVTRKLDDLVALGLAEFSKKDKKTLVSLTEDGKRITAPFIVISSELMKMMIERSGRY